MCAGGGRKLKHWLRDARARSLGELTTALKDIL